MSITFVCDALLLKQRKTGIFDRRYPVIMGVPVAKITPLPPVFSSRYLHLRKRSSAFCEAELEIPATFCDFMATNRFLNSDR